MINLLKNKDKEKIVRAFGEKQCITYGKKIIQMTENFSSETTEVRRNWHIFQAVKEKNCQMKFYVQGNYTSEMMGEYRHFQVKAN